MDALYTLIAFAATATALLTPSHAARHAARVLHLESHDASLADALHREASKRSISHLPIQQPSPLLPPDKALRTVLEALRRPDVPEIGAGLALAFEFSEPDPEDGSRRSSWAFGEMRGRCNWAARGLPILDRTAMDVCEAAYDDEGDECKLFCDTLSRDQLFLDADAHADELATFFSTLLHHDSVSIMASPRWGAEDLVEFDLIVETDSAAPAGSLKLRGRVLLHRCGPLGDTWFVRGCTLLCEEPSP